MKKYKVLKALTLDATDYAVGAIVELDDETATALIAEGAVEEFVEPSDASATPPASPAEGTRAAKPAWKIRSATPPKETRTSTSDPRPSLIRTIMRAQSTRSAADFAATELTDILGMVGGGNVLFTRASKILARGNVNVVYADWSEGNPTIGLVAECTKGDSETNLAHYIAIQGKYSATVPVCNEYLEDNPNMDSFVRSALARAAGIGADAAILTGAFTNSIGLRGIIGDTTRANAMEVGASSAAVTRAQLDALLASLYPELMGDVVLAFNPKAWNAFVATLNPTNMCCGDVVTGKNPSYRGWPVLLTAAVSTSVKVVAGDFSHYTIGVGRQVTVETDKSAGFAEDATLYRVSMRLAGGIAGSKDVDGYAFFAYGTHT